MEEIIKELESSFKDAVPTCDEKLCEAFRNYLVQAVDALKNNDSKFVENDEESIVGTLKTMTDMMISMDLDSIKRQLIVDKNFEKLNFLSNYAWKTAEHILKGNSFEIDLDINEKIEEMKKLESMVEEYNKRQARVLLSEGILDWKYIENPETDMVSLRLGRAMRRLNEEKQEIDEK